MKYWLMKSEPDVYSIEHLAAEIKGTAYWDGIRNYQARNFIRDDMKVGDLAFFYHSNCAEPGIVGVMEIASAAYPDYTAFDPKEKYFDSKSEKTNPRWFMVDVKLRRKFRISLSLKDIRLEKKLSKMKLVQPGNRLSISPVTKIEWDHIMAMVDGD
ncbi:MAG: EVE domain-containing protein [Acidiferrobacteraceae bacterium]|nr:EVE domain-containing protein [Acidiferrobacteraceae bacterium]|tara:strand:+ start:260 stop:727 length:468 start_codon:yes stop_codon:yes gene_type:complete